MRRKRIYFSRLAVTVRPAMRVHRQAGLWDSSPDGEAWRNVSAHCLVEAARVRVLARKLEIPVEITQDLVMAAALHDFFKRREKEMRVNERWERYEEVAEEANRWMRAAGFSERVVRLVNSVGYPSIDMVEPLLDRETLGDEDVACLVLHYVDAYTIDDCWVTPILAGPVERNDLDRRMDKNEANPFYARINAEVRQCLRGETGIALERQIGALVERRLAALVNARSGEAIEPKRLPEMIDREIAAEITLSASRAGDVGVASVSEVVW